MGEDGPEPTAHGRGERPDTTPGQRRYAIAPGDLVATSRSQSGSALSRKAIERSTPDVGFREP